MADFFIGESLVGDGNEIAHIDLIIGSKTGPAGQAFCNALTNNKDGFTTLLAVVDSVEAGVIPQSKADDYCIAVGVFIHWEAADDTKIYDYNYKATREAIERALANKPSVQDVLAGAKTAKHPFSPK